MTSTTLRHTALAPIWIDMAGDIDEVSWDGAPGTQSGTAVFLLQRRDGEVRSRQYLTYRETMREAIALAKVVEARMVEFEDLVAQAYGLDWYDVWNLRRDAALDTVRKAELV